MQNANTPSAEKAEEKGLQIPSLVPKLELPKSGGAIKGIGESYTANPATGTGNFSVPIGLTAGRGAPQLTLSYSSGGGNSPFGLGWSISLPQISRKTERQLPLYHDAADSDVFLLSGAEDLVPKLDLNQNGEWEIDEFTKGNYEIRRYRPRTEGLFARIERHTHIHTGQIHWQSISGQNITSIYGATPDSRVADPQDRNKIFQWLICKTSDSKGNVTLFEYKAENNEEVDPSHLSELQRKNNPHPQRYLKRILYGNQKPFKESDFLFHLVLDYGEHDEFHPTPDEINPWHVRQDSFSSYRAGFEIRTRRLCKRILMFHDFPAQYGLEISPRLVQSTELAYDENPVATQLKAITKVAWEYENNQYTRNDLPPVEFAYSAAKLDDRIQEIDSIAGRNAPQGLSGSYQFTDLHAEGLNGVLIETASAWYYKRNLGEGTFAALETISPKPNWSDLGGSTQISNLEANGQLYLSRLGQHSGYTKRDHNGSWSPFRTFGQTPNINLSDPDIRHIDLNGDGKPEILILRDELLRWYPNEGEAGYAEEHRSYTGIDEDKGPNRIFQNDLESIFLSDMTGDGLSDIVRIRNQEICYWPNLGYGRFGERVLIDDAPKFEAPDLFDPKRLRLGDIDGSGTTDILYLGRNNTHYWLNQSGNRLSEAIEILHLPPTTQLETVSLTDLLGNGTACLVWSSPLPAHALRPWRYIDIMSSTKPYLLTEIRNNMGAVSRVRYKPSTWFYLKDERENRPWVCKLPFPVQVVHQTEIEDLITGHRFVSEYAYHHGYYDRVEREFRGFGFVEQWDDESFKDPDKDDPFKEFQKPRICTKSWFHVGAWEHENMISRQYEHEYWNGSRLHESELLNSQAWSAVERREAKRAFRGQLLRQEVFTEGDHPDSDKPYVVTESRYQVKQLQPITERTRHAVYISLPLETLSAHYERNADDPRLGHEMTLEVDDFGNVKRSATIAYPRNPLHQGKDDHCIEQDQLHIVCIENEFFNQDDDQLDWYVKGVPLSSSSYEITNQTYSFSYPQLFTKADVLPLSTGTNKKILSAQAHYYRKNSEAMELDPTNMSLLPVDGPIESDLLPHSTYQLVFKDDILNDAYSGKLSQTDWEKLLTDEKYEQTTHANIQGWWVSGGFSQFDPHNFFISEKSVDPWGNESSVEFDKMHLLPVKVTDPLGNTITAIYDYRILQPLEITDPNGNRQRVAYDGFGRVIRTAVMGKVGENKGDELSLLPRSPHSPSDSDTTVTEYYHEEFWKHGRPNYVHTYNRETHHHDLPAGDTSNWLEARVYSDGFGRELQSKAKVAQGKAHYVENGVLKSKDTSITNEDRWLGSGRTIYDNKGQAVKQYEPYFSTTENYEDEDKLVHWGVSPFIHYDALGRVVQTDMPDGTFSKVEFTPWVQKTFDANDTVLDSEWYKSRIDPANTDPKTRRAATLSAKHANLPAIALLDSLSRVVRTQQEIITNTSEQGTNKIKEVRQHSKSRVVLDIVGNPLQTWDANGNLALEAIYDLAGRPLKSVSNDAGTSWRMLSIDNQPVYAWLPRGQELEMEYDPYRRPVKSWIKDSSAALKRLQSCVVYGNNFLPNPDYPTAESANMRGQVWKSYDKAGMVEVLAYDFKGAPLESHRYLFEDHTEFWTEAKIDDPIPPVLERFISSNTFDALGRPVSSTTPDQSIQTFEYDAGGQLLKVLVDAKDIVSNITYNEKGQRMSIRYGNGVRTKYTYNPLSYRLTSIHTQHDAHLSGKILQDLHYTYDAVGNIVEIEDKTQTRIFANNQLIEPGIQQFEYDSLNRLLKATGVEHPGQQNNGLNQITHPASQATEALNAFIGATTPNPNNLQQLSTYTQCYAYDQVGNILRWKHTGTYGYTRDYTYQTGNNRLSATFSPSGGGAGGGTSYTYDPAGNIQKLPHHSTPIQWDENNQPVFMDFGTQQAHYIYDGSGERIRKVIDKGNDLIEERIYLGNYETYRVYQNKQLQKERTSLHIADDTGRICLIETLIKDMSPSGGGAGGGTKLNIPCYRYQLSNHLGSVGMEIDDTGDIISYESYHPYGTTAYHWQNTDISQKRYRYTGKERDKESGLSYHSARYYMPWLGRWLSADPAGMVDGACLYQYGLSNPVGFRDGSGLQTSDQDTEYDEEFLRGSEDVSIPTHISQEYTQSVKISSIEIDIDGDVTEVTKYTYSVKRETSRDDENKVNFPKDNSEVYIQEYNIDVYINDVGEIVKSNYDLTEYKVKSIIKYDLFHQPYSEYDESTKVITKQEKGNASYDSEKAIFTLNYSDKTQSQVKIDNYNNNLIQNIQKYNYKRSLEAPYFLAKVQLDIEQNGIDLLSILSIGMGVLPSAPISAAVLLENAPGIIALAKSSTSEDIISLAKKGFELYRYYEWRRSYRVVEEDSGGYRELYEVFGSTNKQFHQF